MILIRLLRILRFLLLCSHLTNLCSMHVFTRGHLWLLAEMTACCGPEAFRLETQGGQVATSKAAT